MGSSSGPRVRVACDACGACAWIGPGGGGTDAWCEACQRPARLAGDGAATCPECGGALATSPPGFPELWGRLQHLDAVLAGWCGDAAPLLAILPDRPRFLTDLDPPAAEPGDPPALAAVLAEAARGAWSAVLAAPPVGDARAHAARAIALERTGEPAAAAEGWTRVLAAGEDARARLARGALRAKAGEWERAAADFAAAGDRVEARWNRAALAVHRAVAATPGILDPRALEAARTEAGPASEYWSDPTVGRLAVALVAERALARREAGELGDLDRGALREAEDLLEHRTFWDRALVLASWVRLGLEGDGDAARIARPLARELASELLAEPVLKGAPLAGLRAALERAWDAAAAFEPRTARAAVEPWLAHAALRRYRIPCRACGAGAVGVEAWEECAPPGAEAV